MPHPRLLTLSLLLAAIPLANAQSATPAPAAPPAPTAAAPSILNFDGAVPPLNSGQPTTPPPGVILRTPSQKHMELLTRNLIQQTNLVRAETCYAIRSYTVAPDSPGSDSTHLTGSSTCQPAANFKPKAVAAGPHPDTDPDPQLIAPR